MSELRKILIVDDDREIVRGMSIRLRAAGNQVITAENGERGLCVALEHRPDVIVLDMRMPVMDGLTMLGKLMEHEQLRDIPVIMLSANVVETTRQKALELGARYFLEKPYRHEQLIAALDSVKKNAVVQG